MLVCEFKILKFNNFVKDSAHTPYSLDSKDYKMPEFYSILRDHKVTEGGTVALQVEVKGRVVIFFIKVIKLLHITLLVVLMMTREIRIIGH